MATSVPTTDDASDATMRLRGLAGLDVDAGLAFVGNSADVYLRLLKRFAQLHEGDVLRMIEQAERAERLPLQKLAHSIKGGAATLGASGLAQVARQLEEACPSAPPSRLVALARALEAEHAALCRHLVRACGDLGAAHRP